jgi:hypothetical protein
MRRSVLLVVLVALLLAAIACGSSTNGDKPSAPDVEADAAASGESAEADVEEEPTSIPTETPEPTPTELPPVGTSRGNPAPIGQAVEVPNYRFVVNSVAQPADDIVAAGNMFNIEPETGQEYLMVELTLTCLASECSFSPTDFDVLGDKGVAYEVELFVSGIDGVLELTELMEGAELTGKMFFLVDQDDTNLVLRWKPLLGSEVFLAVGEFDPGSFVEEVGEVPDVEPIETSREDPAPFGQPLAVPNFIFTVLGITRPADDIVAAANPFNSEPEAGQEYLMVELEVICRESECSFSPYNLTVVGSSGIAHEFEAFVSGVEGSLEYSDLLRGASVSGKLFFFVGKEETDLVLRWEPLVGGEAFLSLEQ